MMTYKEKFARWISMDIFDDEVKKELKTIDDEKEIEDRFYKDLEFGTGGLRGIIGAGDNRLNIYTVGRATQGLSVYLKDKYKDRKDISVSIAYDSRNMSQEFAECAALVFAANGIKANLFESLRPTPELSFAVRELKCQAGIVITASHNPKEYNGYKVYDEHGCQITDVAAKNIIDEIESIDYDKIKKTTCKEALDKGLLIYIGADIDKKFIDTLKQYTIRKDLVKEQAKNLKIIYTPIYGTGRMPVKNVLTELGYENLNIVKEQELPDGNFPTAPYPNPEDPAVFKIALEMAKELNPDIILGTDPDADRLGVVVKDSSDTYKVLTGNQVGILLTHYVLSSLKATNKLPQNACVIKTIVSTEMVKAICKDFGVEIFEVLTGFKYIGEMMTKFQEDKSHEFIFGFEESYGYLYGTHARDKDAVVAAQLVCEMTLYYKSQGISLYEAFVNLCDKYGYYIDKTVSVTLKGKEGQEKIQQCLESLRKNPVVSVDGVSVDVFQDYRRSISLDLRSDVKTDIDLPKSNVLKYMLNDLSWFIVRPSGTEPKLKIYLSAVGKSFDHAQHEMSRFEKQVMNIIGL